MGRILLAILVVVFLSFPAAAHAQQTDALCFRETVVCINGTFLQFWRGNGGLPVFGLALVEQRQERSPEGVFLTQWFERERFEYHAELQPPYNVLLGRLGDEVLRRQGRDWRGFPTGQPKDGCEFFQATSHTLCEPFLTYWRTHGLEFDGRGGASFNESLALFGQPLSEPTIETNSSGDAVLTQWFERARFEYHPNNPDPYKVLLGRLGAEMYDPTAGNGPTQYHQVQQPGWKYPLEVPRGFTIDEVASGLNSPRFMARDPADGSLVYGASFPGEVVRLRDTNGDGRYDQQQQIASGLTFVHSVAFANGQLYAAAEDRLVRLSNFGTNGVAQTVETIVALPTGAKDLYGHRTRTVAQGPDGKLYVSVGSSCDVCLEDTPQRAAILRLNPDGSGLEVFASGLRNTVGFDWRPYTSELWGVDMGRNNIGLDNPPDELNVIQQGKNYGWPFCHGSNTPNPEFNDPGRCASTVPPAMPLPAHWSPLGFLFYTGLNFPATYQNSAVVAFHGTARDQVGNQLNGYNVVSIRFKNGGPDAASMQELVRGWNVSGDVWGRPAGLLQLPDGSLLISDDNGGRIFRLRYIGG